MPDFLETYFSKTTGIPITVTDPEPVLAGSVPFLFRQKYGIRQGIIRDYRILLLYQSGVPGTPREIRQDRETLERLTNQRIVFVFDALRSFDRQRLIDRGVQFIVPGTQLFLPDLMIDLRARTSQITAPEEITRYSYSTQVLLFYHLLIEPIDSLELKEIASRLRYSPMTMTRAQRELTLSGTAGILRAGKKKNLEFHLKGRDLWQHVRQYVRNPVVRKLREVSPAEIPSGLSRSGGLSALSERTMIGEPEIPVIAVGKEIASRYLGQSVSESEHTEAVTNVEIWAYNPILLSPAGPSIDPLSLYCSLSGTTDERIESALEELERSLQW